MKKKRKLLNGGFVNESPEKMNWAFESQCPEKWIHIDCENGHIYVKSEGSGWTYASKDALLSAEIALRAEIRVAKKRK